jgi:4-amino-4-deoxy-L-arabinose transferase-like glycosyltransferase
VKKIFYPLAIVVLLLFAVFFFSLRLTQTPNGMTGDESSIGYNSVLISQNLHDETGRHFPVFILTMNGADWKQPISIYTTAIFFKIFGASLFNLKFVNVLVAVISLLLIIVLNYHLLGKKAGIVSGIIFLLTPTILIHSHLAQENIMPVLFISAWLLFLLLHDKKSQPLYLLLAGISLGLGIYCYKGMRALVPPLILLTEIYLFFSNRKNIKSLVLFSLGLLPFILIMPWINAHYAGALFDNQGIRFLKYYDFFYPYLSSFDLSALFIKGDITPWHSTGLHGVFLLSTLPLFIAGLVQAVKDKRYHHFYLFLLLAFFLCPLLYGQVGSVYRFSRLLIFVPFYISFCTLSFLNLLKMPKGKLLSVILGVFMLFNFVDFVRYYWYSYPVIQKDSFSENHDSAYRELAIIAKTKGLTPYIYTDEYRSQGDDAHFYESAYFTSKLGQWKPGDVLPPHSVLMTKLEKQTGLISIGKEGDMSYLISQ